MHVLIASVPHTGSRFTVSLFTKVGFVRHKKPRKNAHSVRLTHVRDDDEWRIVEKHQGPLIVPIRHPLSCARSYANRDEDVRESWGYWRRLIDQVIPLDPLLLPIDAADRDGYLEKINSELGLSLTTDWKKFQSKAPFPRWLTPAEVQGSLDILKDPFFERFYGSPA